MDESNISTVQVPKKVLSERGQHQLGRVTSAERGQITTIICCMSATGFYVPPFFIFKRVRMSELLMKDSTPGAVGKVSFNGWSNKDILLNGWLILQSIQTHLFKIQLY